MAKIMLVEDDTNLREIYQARLAAEGYEVVVAKDGEEALAIAVKEKPQLILCDVMMPKVSGFEMLDILRSTSGIQNIKVIMMTALSQAEDKERAEKLGADRYLVKSQVTLEDMAKSVKDVLDEGGDSAEQLLTNANDKLNKATGSDGSYSSSDDDDDDDSDNVTVAKKKVIKPINDLSKDNSKNKLDELLAKEEAKEQILSHHEATVVASADTPAPKPPEPAPLNSSATSPNGSPNGVPSTTIIPTDGGSQEPDPNSISL